MKEMTKEELIEYFIEILGNNEILGQFMSINQIREKLSTSIKEVIYTKQGDFRGAWNASERTLKFNLSAIENHKKTIVHELLHVLSTAEQQCENGKKIKSGIHYYGAIGDESNRGINEGITECLANEICGIKAGITYEKEIEIYKVLSIVLGQDTILKKYFEGFSEADEKKKYDIFKDTVIGRYGEEIGTKINDDIKKLLALSDQRVILDMIRGLERLIISPEEKRINEQIEETINDMLKQILSVDKISAEEKLKIYRILDLRNYSFTEEEQRKLYELYVDSSKITEGDFDKSDMFMSYLYSMSSRDQHGIFAEIDKLEYRKIGDYYQCLNNDCFFDEEGFICFQNRCVDMKNKHLLSLEDLKKLRGFSFDKEYLCEQLNQEIERKKSEENEQETIPKKIQFIGEKLIKITWNKEGEKKDSFFTINDDGVIKKAQIRSTKKIIR